jgi:hypothetical protein
MPALREVAVEAALGDWHGEIGKRRVTKRCKL